MNWIGWIVLAALVVDAGLHLTADLLNLKRLSTRIPAAFEGIYDPQRYARSQAYLKDRTHFGWIAAAVDLSALLLFWFLGGFTWLDNWARALPVHPVGQGLAFVAVLAAAKGLLSIPLGAWSTFVIENRYGFNRTSLGIWVTDRLKGAALAVAIGAPLLAAVLVLLTAAGPHAWFYCWLAVTGCMLLIQSVAPTWILPLFNRFAPLPPGGLREAITAYARSVDFTLDNIYEMDGSKRSSKSNAFFTGFGRRRRIVLFDTLIAGHSTPELVAVLAHEMGHFKQRHIAKMLAAGILQTGIAFYLLSLCIAYPPLFTAFFIPEVSVHAGLVLFGLLYAPVDFFSRLGVNYISRRHEFAADRYAVQTTGDPTALADALRKLTVDNLGNLNPHPFYVALNHSHPPVIERLAAISKAVPRPSRPADPGPPTAQHPVSD
jgi:STE24 endopeptidase